MATQIDEHSLVSAPEYTGARIGLERSEPRWVLITISGEEPISAALFGAFNGALADFVRNPPSGDTSFGELVVIALGTGSVWEWLKTEDGKLVVTLVSLGAAFSAIALDLREPRNPPLPPPPLIQCIDKVTKSAPGRELTIDVFEGEQWTQVTFKQKAGILDAQANVTQKMSYQSEGVSAFKLSDRLVRLERREGSRFSAYLEEAPDRESLEIELQGAYRVPGTEYAYLSGWAVKTVEGRWRLMVERIVPVLPQDEVT